MTKKYVASQAPAEVRVFAARLLFGLEKLGVEQELVLEVMREAGYVPSSRTVRRHEKRVRSGETVLSWQKASGRPCRLDEAEREICAGFVLPQNLARKEVHLADYLRFIAESFQVKLSRSTASRYLEETGFHSRMVHSKAAGFKLDAAAECRMMLNWVNGHEEQFKRPRSHLASIDFTYTGHRTDHRVSYSASGVAQPKSNLSISRFTNCILTVVWADGVNRTPPVIFTLNPLFRFDRSHTPKRDREVERLENLLAKHEIHRSRVVYVGKVKGENGVYVPESADLVRRFWRTYEVPRGVAIFSDEGRSFFPGGASVLEELVFDQHEAYPPAVHHYLSPNDNCLHGSAKQRWRTSGVDFRDDVASSLQLLNHLDGDLRDGGKDWWARNMLNLTHETVEELIAQTGKRRAELNKRRLRDYQVFMGQDPKDLQPDLSSEIDKLSFES